MNKLQFKTNINCSGCVAKVTNQLNATVGEGNWQVDTANPDKPLTITNPKTTAEEVSDAVKKAGFKAEVVED